MIAMISAMMVLEESRDRSSGAALVRWRGRREMAPTTPKGLTPSGAARWRAGTNQALKTGAELARPPAGPNEQTDARWAGRRWAIRSDLARLFWGELHAAGDVVPFN